MKIQTHQIHLHLVTASREIYRHWLETQESHKTILSITLGLYLGIFPIVGCSTLFCLLACHRFRLNYLLTITVNMLVAPLQLLLLYPYYLAGQFFARLAKLPTNQAENLQNSSVFDLESFTELPAVVAGGILSWALLSLGSGFLFYQLLRFLHRLQVQNQ